MAKKMTFFAVVFCSMAMLSSNASAAWLTNDDSRKQFVSEGLQIIKDIAKKR